MPRGVPAIAASHAACDAKVSPPRDSPIRRDTGRARQAPHDKMAAPAGDSLSGTSNLAALVAWGGFILGFVFGAVANRTNFCTMGAVSDVVNMGSWGRMRMWLLAIAVAILGTQALQV